MFRSGRKKIFALIRWRQYVVSLLEANFDITKYLADLEREFEWRYRYRVADENKSGPMLLQRIQIFNFWEL